MEVGRCQQQKQRVGASVIKSGVDAGAQSAGAGPLGGVGYRRRSNNLTSAVPWTARLTGADGFSSGFKGNHKQCR